MKNKTLKYINLGIELNALVDKGEMIRLTETYQKIQEKAMLSFLKEMYQEVFDRSVLTDEDCIEIEKYFYDIWSGGSDKDIRIFNNGLCFLVGCCFLQLKENI